MTVPRRLSFSGQLSNCNPATFWHIELSILGLLHLSISIHLRNSFSCSMKFFHLKIVLWLALSESWLLLAQTQKNTDVYKGLLSWEGLPRQTCNKHLRDINSWIKFRLLYDNSFAPARSLCHGKEHHDIDPNMLSSGHHDCSTKAVFLWTAVKLQSCHVLAHWTQQTGPWANLGCGLHKHRKTLMSTKACFCGKVFLSEPAKITLAGACAMGTNTVALIQTCQIQDIMTVPQRLSFSARLTNCNVGPCWHVMARIGACWHSAFSTFYSLGQ